MSAGKRMLVVTTLDLEAAPNNSEHNRIRYYVRHGWQVTAIYKTMNRSRRLRHLLPDTLLASTRVYAADGAQRVAVDPPFNYFAGLGREAGVWRADAGSARRTWKQRGLRLLAPLAVLRDVFTTPWLIWAAFRRVPGKLDVALGVGPWAGLAAVWLRRLGKVRRVVYVDRDFEAGLMPDRLRASYTAAVERHAIRRSDQVVSAGRMLSERRLRETGVTTCVVGNGVDWDRFDEARSRASDEAALIHVGNVMPWSGVECAIEAMPAILAGAPDATLTVVGAGLPGYVEHLEARVRELRLEDSVRFLGLRPAAELPGLLARASLGLAHSEPVDFRRYAMPLKLLEYMAAGLPAIVTEETEAADAVKRYGCGVAIPYDADSLAHAVLDLLGDGAKRAEMRANASRHGPELDWSRVLEREGRVVEGEEPRA